MTKEVRPLLTFMHEHIQKIREAERRGKDAFVKDHFIHDGVALNFQQLGEAVNKLPPSFKAQFPDVPWRDIVDFRNILVHNYAGINLETVWKVIIRDLPALEKFVNAYLEQNP